MRKNSIKKERSESSKHFDDYKNDELDNVIDNFSVITDYPEIAAVISGNESFNAGLRMAGQDPNRFKGTHNMLYYNALDLGSRLGPQMADAARTAEEAMVGMDFLLSVQRRLSDIVECEHQRLIFDATIKALNNAASYMVDAINMIGAEAGLEVDNSVVDKVYQATYVCIDTLFKQFVQSGSKFRYAGASNHPIHNDVGLASIKEGDEELRNNMLMANVVHNSLLVPNMMVNDLYDMVYAVAVVVVRSMNAFDPEDKVMDFDSSAAIAKIMGYLDGKMIFSDYANTIIQINTDVTLRSDMICHSEPLVEIRKTRRLFTRIYNENARLGDQVNEELDYF